ncbi:MAG: hypothetical protein LIR46_12880 [Bacteroidota bacterium]|nr:hypothetical protein [Bacteroidota bacterium]
MNKETRKIIEKSMSKTVRRDYKNGKEIKLNIKRWDCLKRWGDEMQLVITKNGKIIENDLESACWNAEPEHFHPEEIPGEAKNAVDYYVYGKIGEDFVIEVVA